MGLTIQQATERILDACECEPVDHTVDTLKCGDPGAELTGIVTTFMATRAVLAEAAKRNVNLVITHEPTFYGHRDETDWLGGDPVYEAKREALDSSGIAVWRFHDYWHRTRPDGILMGMVRALDWSEYQDKPGERIFTLPETSVRELAEQMKSALGIDRVRVAGDLEMTCSRVALRVGASGGRAQMLDLRRDDVDVVACGESPEWETCEYVRDAAYGGLKKALIVLGHCDSEEAGMEYLVEWLKGVLPDAPASFVAAGNPFTFA